LLFCEGEGSSFFCSVHELLFIECGMVLMVGVLLTEQDNPSGPCYCSFAVVLGAIWQ
jgi:hypothetical protein